ncbi:unnamed protein product [Anisakis simplex]|uniref:Heparan-sulfate 6-O-sulfotransferase n=1 Tax=Anisakis simplex TaxID=6269 RepID=A0A0M3JMY1_ANISI|nr:unnamed protein product [Anisakis simplex]
MALSGMTSALYRNVTRRFSTLFLAAVVGAFTFDLVLNRGTDFYWDMVSSFHLFRSVPHSVSTKNQPLFQTNVKNFTRIKLIYFASVRGNCQIFNEFDKVVEVNIREVILYYVNS